MSLRVTVTGKVKYVNIRSRSESEFKQSEVTSNGPSQLL